MHEEILEYAIRYAHQGLQVFPVGPDKVPMVARGFKAGSSNPAEVSAMFYGRNVPMIGFVHNKFMILDFDGELGWQTYHEYGYRFPTPLASVRTRSGGLHLYYPNPEGKLKRRIKYLPNMDVLAGNGGYAIAPPSVGYEFITGSMEDTLRRLDG